MPATERRQVAVVTGVGRRGQVGEAVAIAFGSLGWQLVLIGRDGAEVSARADELRAQGWGATAHGCDLTDAGAVDEVARHVSAETPQGVQALVCVAGGFAPGSNVADTSPDAWHRMFSVNLTTAFCTTRAFLPLIRTAHGAIVYFASAAALPGGKVSGMAAYSAAKTGVVTLMRAVALEEKGAGVRANALAPTSIRTVSNVASMGEDAAYVERETVAEWVVLLCSATSAAISGQVVKLG
ncbi:MAG: SDR family NAD(P)-dependent oxidoreductase [Gemmatimonadaceae bacterium]